MPEQLAIKGRYGFSSWVGDVQYRKDELLESIRGIQTPYTGLDEKAKEAIRKGEGAFMREGSPQVVIGYDAGRDEVQYVEKWRIDKIKNLEASIQHLTRAYGDEYYEIPLSQRDLEREKASLIPRRLELEPEKSPGHDNWGILEAPEIKTYLEMAGFSGAIMQEKRNINAVIFDPSNIREIGAAFDPQKSKAVNLYAQSAFHGTAHSFEEFSLSGIGSGDGEQVFGWGLCFSTQREVADEYRANLAGSKVKTDSGEYMLSELYYALSHVQCRAINFVAINGGDFTKSIAIAQGRGESEDVLDALTFLQGEVTFLETQGNLYQVNIPDKNEVLDWGKPLGEQPEKIIKAIRDSFVCQPIELHHTGRTIYRKMSAELGSDKAASEHLNSIGVPGLCFLDGTGLGKPRGMIRTYSYVIWDENRISIEAVNDAPSLVSENTLLQTAYHGSPHSFKQFETTKIGTGDGSQAYGRGLYFADKKKKAEWYRDALQSSQMKVNGEVVPNISGGHVDVDALSDILQKATSANERDAHRLALIISGSTSKGTALRKLHRRVEEYQQSGAYEAAQGMRGLQIYIHRIKSIEPEPTGSLYEVDIPENNDLLNLDAPLWDQPSNIKGILIKSEEKINNLLNELRLEDFMDKSAQVSQITGSAFYRELQNALEGIPENRRIVGWDSQKERALFLRSMGISGVRYLDGSNLGQNYVIWDDDEITVKAINEQKVSPDKSLHPQLENWFSGSVVKENDDSPRVVYRGQHGNEDYISSRLGSFSFGDNETASHHAEHPNDRNDVDNSAKIFPAFLSIKNPVLNSPGDPFIDMPILVNALGKVAAIQIAIDYQDRIRNIDNWSEISNETEMPTIAALLASEPNAIARLNLDAYPIFDDPDIVDRLRLAGFDGAIHASNGPSALTTKYKVFDSSQIRSAISPNIDITKPLDVHKSELPTNTELSVGTIAGMNLDSEKPGENSGIQDREYGAALLYHKSQGDISTDSERWRKESHKETEDAPPSPATRRLGM